LRIQVNHQCAQPLPGTDGSEIAGDGGFANASFLIENDVLHGVVPGEMEW
jgi:hypothetical protein